LPPGARRPPRLPLRARRRRGALLSPGRRLLSSGPAGGRTLSATEPSRATPPPAGPIALDGLAYGIDLLDALLVFHLGDAHVHALWVRPEGGVRAEDVVTTLRDAYRVAQFAGKRLSGVASPRAEAPAPLLTIELPQRLALLRRIRAYVVACIFDAAMPLEMARLIGSRLAGALEPELPLAPEPSEGAGRARVAIPAPPSTGLLSPAAMGGALPFPLAQPA